MSGVEIKDLEPDCLVLIDTLQCRALSRIPNNSVSQFPHLEKIVIKIVPILQDVRIEQVITY